MIAYQVDDMTCGHCISMITKAVKGVNPNASIDIDLGTKRVSIDSALSDAPEMKKAIAAAGYTPVEAPLGLPVPATAGTPAKAGGCC